MHATHDDDDEKRRIMSVCGNNKINYTHNMRSSHADYIKLLLILPFIAPLVFSILNW